MGWFWNGIIIPEPAYNGEASQGFQVHNRKGNKMSVKRTLSQVISMGYSKRGVPVKRRYREFKPFISGYYLAPGQRTSVPHYQIHGTPKNQDWSC